MEHSERLPSPPPLGVSQDFPSKALEIKRNPMARNGFGYKGQKIQLLTNHFNVKVAKTNGHFFHYSVSTLLSISICLVLFFSFFFLAELFV